MKPADQPPQDVSICDLASAIREQDRILTSLKDLAKKVGPAKALREASSDIRKKILSRIVSPMLKEGDSAVSAEHHARASREYHDQLEDHIRVLSGAGEIIEESDVLKIAAEALRTKISLQKSLLNLQ